MNEEMRTRTFEELLINRVAKAFESMDNVNAEFFDEILDELEMLFKLKPDMYEQLLKWKQYHDSIFQQNLELAKQKVALLEDEIAQEITIKYYQTKIEWSYRKDLLETMLNILNEFKLIPFTNPEYAEIETIEPTSPEQPLEPEVPQTPSPPPPPPLPVQPPIQPAQAQPVPQEWEEIKSPVSPPVISSPTLKPTNAPPAYSQPPQQIIEQPDDDLVREARRLAREEEEIRRASEQPPSKPQPPSARPQKKGLNLFKRM